MVDLIDKEPNIAITAFLRLTLPNGTSLFDKEGDATDSVNYVVDPIIVGENPSGEMVVFVGFDYRPRLRYVTPE